MWWAEQEAGFEVKGDSSCSKTHTVYTYTKYTCALRGVYKKKTMVIFNKIAFEIRNYLLLFFFFFNLKWKGGGHMKKIGNNQIYIWNKILKKYNCKF